MIRAELVPQADRLGTAGRTATAVVALAPLLLRLGWWWWAHVRADGASLSPRSNGVIFEHTEIRMTRRLLGRWKVRVISTRWQPLADPEPAADRPRQRWVAQLGRALLVSASRLPEPPSAAPRLSAPVPARRPGSD